MLIAQCMYLFIVQITWIDRDIDDVLNDETARESNTNHSINVLRNLVITNFFFYFTTKVVFFVRQS